MLINHLQVLVWSSKYDGKNGFQTDQSTYTLEVPPPTRNASRHEEKITFLLVGNPYKKNLEFATGKRGRIQAIAVLYLESWMKFP